MGVRKGKNATAWEGERQSEGLYRGLPAAVAGCGLQTLGLLWLWERPGGHPNFVRHHFFRERDFRIFFPSTCRVYFHPLPTAWLHCSLGNMRSTFVHPFPAFAFDWVGQNPCTWYFRGYIHIFTYASCCRSTHSLVKRDIFKIHLCHTKYVKFVNVFTDILTYLLTYWYKKL